MSKRLKIVSGAVAALLFICASGFYYMNKQGLGIPAFYVWKALSGQFHGGQYAEVNGIHVYYELYGQGSPVLVLHGGTAFIESMHYQISDLAKDHLVIAVDSRGHGRSTDGDGPLHYAQMSDDMLALLDRLKIKKVDIVGWSDGGIIALDLAMRHPDRVRRIAVSGANFDADGLEHMPDVSADPSSEEVAGQRAFYAHLAPDPAHWPMFYHKVLEMWAREPHYTAAQLAMIKAPVLVIAGEFDGIKRVHTDTLTKAISGAEEVIIKGASHFAPMTHHREVDADIASFLAHRP